MKMYVYFFVIISVFLFSGCAQKMEVYTRAHLQLQLLDKETQKPVVLNYDNELFEYYRSLKKERFILFTDKHGVINIPSSTETVDKRAYARKAMKSKLLLLHKDYYPYEVVCSFYEYNPNCMITSIRRLEAKNENLKQLVFKEDDAIAQACQQYSVTGTIKVLEKEDRNVRILFTKNQDVRDEELPHLLLEKLDSIKLTNSYAFEGIQLTEDINSSVNLEKGLKYKGGLELSYGVCSDRHLVLSIQNGFKR